MGTYRILIVDDNEHVRFVLASALKRVSDYTVVEAENSIEALERAREEPFDLLITDLRLPRMNGLALTSAFASLRPDKPVIWITAYGCRRVKRRGEKLRIHCCLDKPLEIHEIRSAVREALAHTREHAETAEAG